MACGNMYLIITAAFIYTGLHTNRNGHVIFFVSSFTHHFTSFLNANISSFFPDKLANNSGIALSTSTFKSQSMIIYYKIGGILISKCLCLHEELFDSVSKISLVFLSNFC